MAEARVAMHAVHKTLRLNHGRDHSQGEITLSCRTPPRGVERILILRRKAGLGRFVSPERDEPDV